MNEHPYCPDVIHELLRERQRLPHQSRNPLPQRVVHSFYIARQAAIFADSNMPFARPLHMVCIQQGLTALRQSPILESARQHDSR